MGDNICLDLVLKEWIESLVLAISQYLIRYDFFLKNAESIILVHHLSH